MTDNKYNKIKHLVEVDDDILAVFTINLGGKYDLENLSIAKNANIENDLIDLVHAKIQQDLKRLNLEEEDELDQLKWTVNETERIRILTIYEKDRVAVVLINSNVSLSETVDNILGYYYESENDL